MNRNITTILLIIVAGSAGFGGGYYYVTRMERTAGAGQNQTSGTSQGANSGAVASSRSNAELVADYAESVGRDQLPFKDQAEFLLLYQKLDQQKAMLAERGSAAGEEIIKFLGPAGSVSMLQNAGSQGNAENDAILRRRLNPAVREALVDLLASVDPARAAEDLSIRLLDTNETSRVRSKCAGKLATLDAARSVPALVTALDSASESAWDNCRSIVEALQYIKGPEAESAILRAFQRQTTESGLKTACAQALGILNSKNFIPALEANIRFETRDHYVRREAVRSLVKIDSAKAAEVIKDQIPKELDPPFMTFLESVLSEMNRLAKK
ncbi:MAG: HEAT repeat domain-containing protein [Planctomycetota bacterium]